MYNIAQALAAPVVFTWKKRSMILHPLTLREWVLLDDAFQKPDDVDSLDAVIYAIWLSVRKSDSRTSRKWVNRWAEKSPDALAYIWDRLIQISMPPPPKKDPTEKEADLLRQKNVISVFGIFAELYHWDANQVGLLTPLQLCMYLDLADKQNNKPGVQAGSIAEAQTILTNMRKEGRFNKD